METLVQLRGKMTQAEVAKKLNISKSYLSLIEKGKRRLSLELANEMAKLYGVTLEKIYCAYDVNRTLTTSTDQPQSGAKSA